MIASDSLQHKAGKCSTKYKVAKSPVVCAVELNADVVAAAPL